MFLHESIKDEFTEKIVERTKNIKVGHPADPGVQMGAMISEDHLKKVLGYVQSAKDEVNETEDIISSKLCQVLHI